MPEQVVLTDFACTTPSRMEYQAAKQLEFKVHFSQVLQSQVVGLPSGRSG